MYHSKMSFRRAAEVLRTEGARSLWFRILGETAYRRAILVERLLQEPVADQQPGVDVEVRPLTPEDLDEYLAHRSGSNVTEIRTRLSHNTVHLTILIRSETSTRRVRWRLRGRSL
jgi:hypothetical protein